MGGESLTDKALALREPDEPSVVGLRESSIVSLAAHGGLDIIQVGAAWHFRRLWEEANQIHHDRATYLEKIDLVGHINETGRDHRPDALDELERCRVMLGVHGYRLVLQVCGCGYHIRDLYAARRDRDTAIDMLKLHLTMLGRLWNA